MKEVSADKKTLFNNINKIFTHRREVYILDEVELSALSELEKWLTLEVTKR